MRSKSAVCAALLVAMLCACTPMHWVKPGANPADLQQDARHCQQEAWREARLRAWDFRPIAPLPYRDAAGRRHYAWPHAPFGDPLGDPYLEESRLAAFCMRTKGYRLEEMPKGKPADTIQPSPAPASGARP